MRNFLQRIALGVATGATVAAMASLPVLAQQADTPATDAKNAKAVDTKAADTKGDAPDALVRRLSNDVLDAIKADKPMQTAIEAGDLGPLQKLVDEKILPYVNFERMTQLAVGRGWRQATPEQKQALVREFRALLVRTYSGSVSLVRDHKVQLKPFRAAPTDTDVVVKTQVVSSRGDPVQLDYRLEKTNADWKVYDVNILGVWLVENYKTSFASEISQGGIDGLIKSLTERNRKSESAKKS